MAIKRTHVAVLAVPLSAALGLAGHEAMRTEAYIPVPGDVPTICVGNTQYLDGRPVKLGDTAEPLECLALFARTLDRFEGAVKECVQVPLAPHEYQAFVSFAYNVGTGAFCNSTLVRKLNQGDYDGACGELLRWRYFQGFDCSTPGNRKCAGLWQRRQAEYAQCMGATNVAAAGA